MLLQLGSSFLLTNSRARNSKFGPDVSFAQSSDGLTLSTVLPSLWRFGQYLHRHSPSNEKYLHRLNLGQIVGLDASTSLCLSVPGTRGLTVTPIIGRGSMPTAQSSVVGTRELLVIPVYIGGPGW